MSDLISREEAKKFLYERLDRLNDDELYDIFSRIIDDMYNELSSVEPEREKGEWRHYEGEYYCGVCGDAFDDISAFCPNCGAKMDVKYADSD